MVRGDLLTVLVVDGISYSVYNAIDVSPALAVGLKHGMLFTAYGEMRVRLCSPHPALSDHQ